MNDAAVVVHLNISSILCVALTFVDKYRYFVGCEINVKLTWTDCSENSSLPLQTDLAVSLGAIGALVFPDVHSSRPNDTYPYTSKISGDAVFEKPEAANFGDPLTRGIPSIEGMYRGPKNLTAFAAIPTQPISYNDALKLLSHLQSKRRIWLRTRKNSKRENLSSSIFLTFQLHHTYHWISTF